MYRRRLFGHGFAHQAAPDFTSTKLASLENPTTRASEGMKVFVHDEYPPETLAMLQALYSRSSFSVEKHVEKVRSRGSSDFMRSYYVGYGHSSIGDCGNTTIFIEGVSLLACKAIQNSQLYSGQETSTRYIDFSGHIPFDPLGNSASRAHASTTAWLAEVRTSGRNE